MRASHNYSSLVLSGHHWTAGSWNPPGIAIWHTATKWQMRYFPSIWCWTVHPKQPANFTQHKCFMLSLSTVIPPYHNGSLCQELLRKAHPILKWTSFIIAFCGDDYRQMPHHQDLTIMTATWPLPFNHHITKYKSLMKVFTSRLG